MADYFFDEEEESNENIDVKNDIYNYKGYFVENEEEEEKKFYEFGAHFPYLYLYKRLEIIAQEREEKKKELEQKLKEKEKEIRDDQIINEESKPNDNLKNLLAVFQQKGKSRNRGEVGNGLTYIPQIFKNNNNHLNVIENEEINLIKSTSGQNQNELRNKINLNLNSALNNNNNNCVNSKNNNKIKSKTNKIKKSVKIPSHKIKIRKRNDNKFLNSNNSLNNNIFNNNILNRTKCGEKTNSKNMTHDIPFISKIKNNLVNKLKSIQYSKGLLKRKKTNARITEQRSNKKINMNFALNKFVNSNNKWSSYSKDYGYQNTKNASSSKNVLSKKRNKTNLVNSKTGISSAHQQAKKPINNIYKNKSIKNININSNNNILNNHIKSIKENNFIQNIKNNIKLNNNKNNKKINNKINQLIISNNNYKSILNGKQNEKPISAKGKKNFEFIENIVTKRNKNKISRNNNILLFNNQSQNNTNKNFHSVSIINNNIINKNNILSNNKINKKITNNYNNLTQQLKPPQNVNIKKEKKEYNKISISKASLKKYTTSNGFQKGNTEVNFNKKAQININVQKKLNNYLSKNCAVKRSINSKDNNRKINKSKKKNLNKNSFIKRNKKNNDNEKNVLSRNRNENSINNLSEKLIGKTDNILLQSKKKIC